MQCELQLITILSLHSKFVNMMMKDGDKIIAKGIITQV